VQKVKKSGKNSKTVEKKNKGKKGSGRSDLINQKAQI